MTYRERLESRAVSLRGWADKRQTAAAEVIESGRPLTSDHAFSTQPGYVPGRARLIERKERAFESIVKAEGMDARATGIEKQLDRSIYSDDPDAAPALAARITGLEVQRAHMKAHNVAFRKENAAALKAEPNLYKRSQMMPHKEYEVMIVTTSIGKNKKRLNALIVAAA